MLTLEAVTQQNVAAFGGVLARCWRETYAGLVPASYLAQLTPESRAARFAEEIEWSPEQFYLARANGAPAGALILSPPAAAGDAGEVQALYLLRAFQGCGGGRQLLAFAAGRLRARGCTRLVLWVLAGNRAARGFYAHMGLTPDGIRSQITLGAPLPLLRYACPLGAVAPAWAAK